MRTLWIILIGALAVIVFDVIGSILSLKVGFDYTSLAFGSLVIYACVGMLASRGSLLHALAAAGIVGLVDSTVGWYLSWMIGPGRVENLTPYFAFLTGLLVTAEAAVTGLIAGMVGLIFRRR